MIKNIILKNLDDNNNSKINILNELIFDDPINYKAYLIKFNVFLYLIVLYLFI